jgi:hypothetical protein
MGLGYKWVIGCPSGIRTPICCSRGSCPTIERRGNKAGNKSGDEHYLARLAAGLARPQAGRLRPLTTLIIIRGFLLMVKPESQACWRFIDPSHHVYTDRSHPFKPSMQTKTYQELRNPIADAH